MNHHLQMDNVNQLFPLALRAKEREVDQYSIISHLHPGFVPANRTMNPNQRRLPFH